MCAKKIFFIALAAFLITVFMAACGNRGGNSTGENVPAAGISISSSNVKAISAAVVNSVNTVKSPSHRAGILPSLSIQIDGDLHYPDFIASQLVNLRSHNDLSGKIQPAISLPSTSFCPISGTFTTRGSIAVDNTTTAGDMFTLSYSNCDDNNFLINGSMVVTFAQVSPGFDFTLPYTLGIDIDQRDFSVDDGNQTVTSNGDTYMLLSRKESGDRNLQLSGNALSIASSSQGETLTNYVYDFQTTSMGDSSVTLQGTLTNTKIDGAVSYASITAFVGNDNLYSGNIAAGELHISTSADNSQAWLTALSDGVNIQINIDTDGDNLVDATVMTTWSELQSL
jgi:hypothetical protein